MKKSILRKSFAILLSIVMFCSCFSAQFAQVFALAQPSSSAETAAEPTSDTMGYGYRGAAKDSYVQNEVIVQIASASSTSSKSVRSVAKAFDLTLENVIHTDETAAAVAGTVSALSGKNDFVMTCVFSTDTEDIISLCDSLNESEDVVYAQPNFIYSLCEETSDETNAASPVQSEADADILNNSPAVEKAETIDAVSEKPVSYEVTTTVPDTDMSVSSEEDPMHSAAVENAENDWIFDYCNITETWNNAAFTNTDAQNGYGRGQGIKIAVIDTGCNTTHEDIDNNLWNDGNGHCGYYAHEQRYIDIGDASNDTLGHGTHCAGIIAMEDNDVGYIGMAPQSNVIVLKADSNASPGKFNSSDLQTSLWKALEFGADIINMSLGVYYFDNTTFQVLQKVSTECVIVGAAGNDSLDISQTCMQPAAYSCVIGCMAMGIYGENTPLLIDISNYDTSGEFYKVAAPGKSVMSLNHQFTAKKSYKALSGTSMATAAISGMIADYMSYVRNHLHFDWTPAQYQYKIENACMNSSLEFKPYSKLKHSQAVLKNTRFHALDLNALFENTAAENEFAGTPAFTFSNPDVETAVKSAMGYYNDPEKYQSRQVDTYDIMRVGYLDMSEDVRTSMTDFSDLPNLVGLNFLNLSGNDNLNEEDLSEIIASCPDSLLYLELKPSFRLQTLSCLEGASFTNLSYLDISENDISDITALARFTALRTLIAKNNEISDISSLKNCLYTKYVDLAVNNIIDPSPALMSETVYYADLSYNEISDYKLLKNYKGAYLTDKFFERSVTLDVRFNHLVNMTEADVQSIEDSIRSQNNKVSNFELNFLYSDQNELRINPIPMRSYSIHDASVTRDALQKSNLNSILGFTPFPADANTGNKLVWSCSEEGYFDEDGKLIVDSAKITSSRTLTVTATPAKNSSAVSLESGQKSQSVKLTILAPEIYSANLSQNACVPGTKVYFNVVTNPYVESIILVKDAPSNPDILKVLSMSGSTPCANNQCKTKTFEIPSFLTNQNGEYNLFLYARDAGGIYSVFKTADVCSLEGTTGIKQIGKLAVSSDAQFAEAVHIHGTEIVNRYGEAASFSLYGSGSEQRAEETYSFSSLNNTQKYLGAVRFDSETGCGFFGLSQNDYPGAKTGTASFALTADADTTRRAVFSVETVAPFVKEYTLRNESTMLEDGYAEYLVKTNSGATAVKAYKKNTKTDIALDVNLLLNAQNYAYSYGETRYPLQYKLWSVKVPLSEAGSEQRIILTAADALGDGTRTVNVYGNETPVTFSLHDAEVVGTQLRGSNLADLTGFIVSDPNADISFTWHCSEDGYFNADGSFANAAISSDRTLTVTCTSNDEECFSTESGTPAQSVRLTIHAPRILNAYFNKLVYKKGETAYLSVLTNQYVDSVQVDMIINDDYIVGGTTVKMTDAIPLCGGKNLFKTFVVSPYALSKINNYKVKLIALYQGQGASPSDIYKPNGNALYNLGTYIIDPIIVKETVTAGENSGLLYPAQIARCGEAFMFSLNAKTANTLLVSDDARAKLGAGTLNANIGFGYFGLSDVAYPSAQTGTANVQLKDSSNPDFNENLSVQTVEPGVYDVSERNTDTYDTDGYMEYLVFTNNGTTNVKAYEPNTTNDLSVETNKVFSIYDRKNGGIPFSVFDASLSYTVWSVKVPFDENGELQPVVLCAADELGDGTKTISLPFENQIQSFSIHDATISADSLAGSNLADLVGLTTYPENSESSAKLIWKCSETGLFDQSGNALKSYLNECCCVDITIKAPKSSYAKSTVTGTSEQTVKLTITAPEVYYIKLTSGDMMQHQKCFANILTNQYASRINLKFYAYNYGTGLEELFEKEVNMAGAVSVANGTCLQKAFDLTNVLPAQIGQYQITARAMDASNHELIQSHANADMISIYDDPDNLYYYNEVFNTISRYGDFCPITCSTSNVENSAQDHAYSIITTASSEKYLGSVHFESNKYCGVFGMPSASYPSTSTGTAEFTIKNEGYGKTFHYTVKTESPKVMECTLRNQSTYQKDGYADYLVRTTWGTTTVKAYALYTQRDLAVSCNLISSRYDENYNYRYCTFSVRVPLDEAGAVQTVTLTAADPLGDGDVCLVVPKVTAMEQYSVHDITVSRDELCRSNLSELAGFTYSPAAATHAMLMWKCSESGYFDSFGNVLVEPSQITSSRTLTLTAAPPSGVNAVSTVSGTKTQTIRLTITAPEIYSAALCETVGALNTPAYFQVVTNAVTAKLILTDSPLGNAATLAEYELGQSALCANNQSKCAVFALPEDITGIIGTHELYLYAVDAGGNCSMPPVADAASHQPCSPAHLGTFKTMLRVDTTESLAVAFTPAVNRYGQAASFAVTGTGNAIKESGDYAVSLSREAEQYLGIAAFDERNACGNFGLDSAELLTHEPGSGTITVQNSSDEGIQKTFTIETLAPQVKSVSARNADTMQADGYVEYLVKTNTAATDLFAYQIGTKKDLATVSDHLFTAFDSEGSYGVYNENTAYKLWSVKIVLINGEAPIVTLTAADVLGEGTETITVPAVDDPIEFTIEDFTVERSAFCESNVNALVREHLSVSNHQSIDFDITCSEKGYIDSSGNVIVSASTITSCRTLVFTAKAPTTTYYKSSVSGSSEQTFKITIGAPEIYACYLTKEMCNVGENVYVAVLANEFTDSVKLVNPYEFSVYTSYTMPASAANRLADNECVFGVFQLPAGITGTIGEYPLAVSACDAAGNFAYYVKDPAKPYYDDVFQHLGTLFVDTAGTYNTLFANDIFYGTKTVNRYGQAALILCYDDIFNQLDLSENATALIGNRYEYSSSNDFKHLYVFGKSASDYPSAVTEEITATFKCVKEGNIHSTAGLTIHTVAPEVLNVSVNNILSSVKDGFINYTVKTNTAATELKAYAVGTLNNIGFDAALRYTQLYSYEDQCFNEGYANPYNYKIWSIKVPLDETGSPIPVTLTAADALGDGTVTKTPATSLKAKNEVTVYPGEDRSVVTLATLSNAVAINVSEEVIGDCLNDIRFSADDADYISVTDSKTGMLDCDFKQALSTIEENGQPNVTQEANAVLENGKSMKLEVNMSRPVVDSFTYDKDNSVLAAGAKVSFTAKTYGSNTLYVTETATGDAAPVLTLTKDDIDAYTTGIDENGNEYTEWHFERVFDTISSNMRVYVSSAFVFDDEFTATSTGYKGVLLTKKVANNADFTQWNAQRDRLSATALESLNAAYGEDSATMQTRLDAVHAFTDNAVLYGLTQSEVDQKTAQLKDLTDALFGYDEYTESIVAYEALAASSNAKFISQTLRELAEEPVNDTNCLMLAKSLDESLEIVNAVIQKADELANFASDLARTIPEISTNEIPIEYSVASYTALKEQYTNTLENLQNGNYATPAAVENEQTLLLNLFETLHEHTLTALSTAPLDKTAGYVILTCPDCGEYFTASFDGTAYQPVSRVQTPEQAAGQSATLPAPSFNIFSHEGYDYSAHAASLRVSESAEYVDFDTTQGMRFTASVKLPNGVSHIVGDGANCITDFGFVYSQSGLVDNHADNLVLGAAQVYSLSVKERNAGVTDFSQWQGVTYHEEDNTLTFNLVINVKAMNWEKDYCARAYITYCVNGFTFTVYDADYSEKNVAYIAREVIASPTESAATKAYCQEKILKHI